MPMEVTGSAARIRASEKDRHASRGLLAQLTSGQPVPWQQLDEPSRIVRRLLDLDLDADMDLLWGDDAEASRAYRKLLRVSRNPSARSLELGSAAVRSTGSVGLDAATPLGNACLIATNVILTSTEVLASPDAAKGRSFTAAARGRELPIAAELDPSQFFYAHGELGLAVCALSPATIDPLRLPTPLGIADQASVVVGERVTLAYVHPHGDVLLRSGVVELRGGRFLYPRFDDEGSEPPDSDVVPITPLQVRGAPVFDLNWRLTGVIRGLDGQVGEMVDVAEIRRELQHVSEHYGAPASQVIEALLAPPPLAVSPTEAMDTPPRPSELIVPLRLRISVAADLTASATSTGSSATPSEPMPAPGPLGELPSAGIDLDATDGPDAVPAWTNEGALGAKGAEHFDRASAQFGNWDQSRLWYWSTRLLLEARRRRRLQSIPGLYYVAAGFMDPHREATSGGHFGLIAYTDGRAQRRSEAKLLEPIELDGWSFPVITRPVEIQLQQPMTVPADGWASCWARTRVESSNPVGPGILTAGHVVAGYTVGQKLPLEDGSLGELIDVAPPGIDAALIKTAQDPPSGATPLSMTPYVAPLSPVSMQLRGRNQPSRVVDVNNTFKFFRSPDLPLRVGLEHAGVAGDSGGLVTNDQDIAIGIYVGRLVNDLGQRLGLAQHISQVAAVMEGMELLC